MAFQFVRSSCVYRYVKVTDKAHHQNHLGDVNADLSPSIPTKVKFTPTLSVLQYRQLRYYPDWFLDIYHSRTSQIKKTQILPISNTYPTAFVLQEWEVLVISKLKWDLCPITPIDFVDVLLAQLPMVSNSVTIRKHCATFIAVAATGKIFVIMLLYNCLACIKNVINGP